MDEQADFLKLSSETTAEAAPAGSPVVTFRGNNYDLSAVIGAVIGGMVLLTCATCNLGYYCLPFIPIILGIFGLITANDSVNPQRTRLLAWLGLGSGAAIILLIALFVAAYIALIIVMAATGNLSNLD